MSSCGFCIFPSSQLAPFCVHRLRDVSANPNVLATSSYLQMCFRKWLSRSAARWQAFCPSSSRRHMNRTRVHRGPPCVLSGCWVTPPCRMNACVQRHHRQVWGAAVNGLSNRARLSKAIATTSSTCMPWRQSALRHWSTQAVADRMDLSRWAVVILLCRLVLQCASFACVGVLGGSRLLFDSGSRASQPRKSVSQLRGPLHHLHHQVARAAASLRWL